jgi:predicted MFS family arabinose efflux permease
MNPAKIMARLFLPRRLNQSLRILLTVNTAMVFVVAMFTPFYAIFVQKINNNIAVVGFSWAVYPIVAGILTFLFSQWEMKVKEQELLLAVSYFIRSLVFLSYAFMGNIAQLIFTQVLWGVGSALGAPAFDATYTAHTSREGSIFEWGQWEGMSSIATGVAALISGVVIQSVGFTWLFSGMALILVVLGIYIWRLPRELL